MKTNKGGDKCKKISEKERNYKFFSEHLNRMVSIHPEAFECLNDSLRSFLENNCLLDKYSDLLKDLKKIKKYMSKTRLCFHYYIIPDEAHLTILNQFPFGYDKYNEKHVNRLLSVVHNLFNIY